jgi:hypothetical protein
MINKCFTLVVITLMVTCLACSSTKVGISREPIALDVASAHFHKELPGVEDMEPIWNLEVIVGRHKEVFHFDSIHFKGAWKVPNVQNYKEGSKLKVRLEESELGTGVKGVVEVKEKEALIYYSIKNKKLYHLVTKIKETETIYLP